MLHAFLGCIGGGMQAGMDWGLDRAMALSTSYTSRESRVLFGVMCVMLVFNMVMLCSMLLRAAPNAPAVAYTQSPAGAAALLEAPYWQARLSSLQSELGLLQGRLEVVSREMSAVVQHLTAQAASAASRGGVNAAAPATPGTEL